MLLLLRAFEERFSESGAGAGGGGGAEEPGLGLDEAGGEIQDESWYKLEAVEAGYSGFDDKEHGYLGEVLLWCWVARQLSIDDGRRPALLKASWVSRFSWEDEDTGASRPLDPDSSLRLSRSSCGPAGRLTEYCW